MSSSNRRRFLREMTGSLGLVALLPKQSQGHVHQPPTDTQRSVLEKIKERSAHPLGAEARQALALKLRLQCALAQSKRPSPNQMGNGDEESLPCWVGSFTKGLPHDQLGEVQAGKYESLLQALISGKHAGFEKLSRGSGRPFINPQAAFSLHLEGADACSFTCLPPPSLGSAEAAAEMVELYWQALARDIPFTEYDGSAVIQRAGDELGRLDGF